MPPVVSPLIPAQLALSWGLTNFVKKSQGCNALLKQPDLDGRRGPQSLLGTGRLIKPLPVPYSAIPES
jgi:hypothetical protein